MDTSGSGVVIWPAWVKKKWGNILMGKKTVRKLLTSFDRVRNGQYAMRQKMLD